MENEEGTRVDMEYRINSTAYLVLFSIGLLFDFVELILGFTGVGEAVNYGIDVIKMVAIPFMLSLMDVPPTNPRIFKRLFLMFLFGLIPYLGSFVPEVAYGIREIIKESRKEDREKIESGEGVEHNKLTTRFKRASKAAVSGAIDIKGTQIINKKKKAYDHKKEVTRRARSIKRIREERLKKTT